MLAMFACAFMFMPGMEAVVGWGARVLRASPILAEKRMNFSWSLGGIWLSTLSS